MPSPAAAAMKTLLSALADSAQGTRELNKAAALRLASEMIEMHEIEDDTLLDMICGRCPLPVFMLDIANQNAELAKSIEEDDPECAADTRRLADDCLAAASELR